MLMLSVVDVGMQVLSSKVLFSNAQLPLYAQCAHVPLPKFMYSCRASCRSSHFTHGNMLHAYNAKGATDCGQALMSCCQHTVLA
jgi:hypothetical protein